jgi:hypothetical protein
MIIVPKKYVSKFCDQPLKINAISHDWLGVDNEDFKRVHHINAPFENAIIGDFDFFSYNYTLKTDLGVEIRFSPKFGARKLVADHTFERSVTL